LAVRRNDLTEPARRLCPAVDAVLAALAESRGCLLARMSGSGATCFGLYETSDDAASAAAGLAEARPGWWVAAGELL
jgi:4-diphosphocytidyl-2-C-methyl-D-erythritol kinase